MVGYWKLDEGSGTTASDSSGNGNTGTLTNGPTWTTGKVGSALSFDGTNDYVTINDNNTLDFGTGDFTISFWLKTAGQYQAIISKYFLSGDYDWIMEVNADGSAQIREGTVGYYVRSTTVINNNAWHYVVARRIGNTTTIFVDGNLEASGNLIFNNFSNTQPL